MLIVCGERDNSRTIDGAIPDKLYRGLRFNPCVADAHREATHKAVITQINDSA
jgi:hypothetical protein